MKVSPPPDGGGDPSSCTAKTHLLEFGGCARLRWSQGFVCEIGTFAQPSNAHCDDHARQETPCFCPDLLSSKVKQTKEPFAMKPLVSILIPAYNAEPWVAETIRSAAAHTWPRKEIIIVDDGSKDRTAEVARQFGSQAGCVVSTKQ